MKNTAREELEDIWEKLLEEREAAIREVQQSGASRGELRAQAAGRLTDAEQSLKALAPQAALVEVLEEIAGRLGGIQDWCDRTEFPVSR